MTAPLKPLEAEVARLNAELAARSRQLSESEARFRDIIERNADCIIVLDHNGVVQFVNQEAVRLFGKPRELLVGSSFGFPVFAGETTELDLPANGSVHTVQMRVVESMWQDAPAYIASLRDVTQRKHAEQSERSLIREQAARSAAETALHSFRFLAESSTRLSLSLDSNDALRQLVQLCVVGIADWAVVYCFDSADNQLRRFDVAHRDPARQPLVDAFRESPLTLHPGNPIEEAMRAGRSIVMQDLSSDDELATLVPDAGMRDLVRKLGMASFMMVPINARGHSLGAVALVSGDRAHSFGEREVALAENLATRAGLAIDNARLYEEARAANQTKTELLAVISHDLRTPVNSIIGYAQLLEMGLPSKIPDDCLERVGRMRVSANHLLYLIDELLAFARVEGEHESVHCAPVDLVAIMHDVRDVMEPLAMNKKLDLLMEMPETPVTVDSDADKLRQVLVNLVGNAVKYTSQGHVRVSIDPSDDAVSLRVHDTGIGIRSEDLPHIFEPFWQVDRSERGVSNGTGLGLSVVQRLVALLGADISVESTPGDGSTFIVTLPRS